MNELFLVIEISKDDPFDGTQPHVFKTLFEAHRRVDNIKSELGSEEVNIKLYQIDLTSPDLFKKKLYEWEGSGRDFRSECGYEDEDEDEDPYTSEY